MSSLRNLTSDLADAIVDDEPIDWTLVEERVSRQSRADIRNLQTIARIGAAQPGERREGERRAGERRERARRRPWWISVFFIVLIGLATSHILTAFVGFLTHPNDDRASSIPPLAPVANMVVYWLIGGFLMVGGRARDRRAWHLGAFFILSASPLAMRFLPPLASMPQSLMWWRTAYPESFMPLLLWLFARDFPHLGHFTRYDLVARFFSVASAILGSVLFLATFLKLQSIEGPWIMLARDENGPYWAIIVALVLLALPIVVLRARTADREEHLRVGLFLAGLVVGSAPILFQVFLAAVIPAYYDWLTEPRHLYVATLVVYGFLLIVPLVSAYAVLVGKLFDVGPIIRRALRHAIARYTMLAVAVLPLAAIIWNAMSIPGESRMASLSPWTLAGGAAIAAAGALLFRLQGRLVVDSRTALLRIGTQLAQAGGIREIAGVLVEHVTRTLGVDKTLVLVRRSDQPVFVPLEGACRPLPADSAIATIAQVAASPVDLDFDSDKSLYRLMPHADKEWIVDGAIALVTSIRAIGEASPALLIVGRKRSELSFTRDDHVFLESVAASAALAFENAWHRETRSTLLDNSSAWNDETAAQCATCCVVQSWDSGRCCPHCGGALMSAALPAVLLGKFSVESKIGQGGMGIVYRAEDLTLGRRVAIKTLPRVSLDEVKRLRNEARAMARVTHPNLAVIYGAEMWRGTPLLIVEYLPGGTLADRLMTRPLGLEEVIALGEALAGALDRMHRIGMLHLDVKPSNVGYADDGAAKLLDFGLARLFKAPDQAARPRALQDQQADELTTASRSSSGLSGTPLYLSPEAIAGSSPDISFDLWSLSVLLFEAYTGRNPFQGNSIADVFGRIARSDGDSLQRSLEGGSEPVHTFFARSLARDPRRRHQTAAQMGLELKVLRQALHV